MIEPKKAAVRPRVIAEQARGTVLLEDLVAEMAAAGDVAGLGLYGPPGSGVTTALHHLAYVFGTEGRLRFSDTQRPVKYLEHEVSGWVMFSEGVRTNQPLLKCRMAGWTRDEWIEYLLAAHKTQCPSVMQRMLNDPHIRSVQGNPNLLRRVLDELAIDDGLPDVQTVLHRIVERHFLDVDIRQEAARQIYLAMSRSSEEEVVEQYAALDLSVEQARLIHVPAVRLMLAAEAARVDLEQEYYVKRVRMRWPRDLIQAVAPRVAQSPSMQHRLQDWICSHRTDVHPIAVSLLHAAAVSWEWPSPQLLGLLARRVNLAGAILDGADCTRLPLAGCTMTGISLSGARLTAVNLTSVQASNASFDDADMHEANLSGFNGASARFVGADMSAVMGNRCMLVGADLSSTNLTEALLNVGAFNGANLTKANLQGARLNGSVFDGTNLTRANLQGASLEECFFDSACLNEADFRNTNLNNAHLSNLDLTVADFRHASFRDAMVDGCNLEGMELHDADFEFACLDRALLTGSLMPRANFHKAFLRGARLAEVEWEGVNLRGADLSGATFHMGSSRSGLVGSTIASYGSRTGFYTDELNEQGFKSPEEIRKANLRGADLRGAKIDHVDFYLVDLRDAVYDASQEEQLRRTGAILEARIC